MIEDVLIRLRRMYADNAPKTIVISVVVFCVFSILGILSDIYLPFDRWLNVARSILIMGPISISAFVIGYYTAIEIILYGSRTDKENFRNYRKDFSPKWRRNISFIIAAFGFVVMYASYKTNFATVVSGLFLALILGLVVFTRLTVDEEEREENNIPDSRDVKMTYMTRKIRDDRKQAAIDKKEAAELKKEERRKNRLNFLKPSRNSRTSKNSENLENSENFKNLDENSE